MPSRRSSRIHRQRKQHGGAPIHDAALTNKLTKVRQLLARGIDVNSKDPKGNTVLMYAIMSGQLRIVQELLAVPGIDVNAANASGTTALMRALDEIPININIVQAILAVPDVNINAQNNLGYTALMDAVRLDKIDLVRMVLAKEGIDVNAKSDGEYTALMWAADRQNILVVNELLAVPGIEIDAKNELGLSALMMRRTSIEIRKRLIEAGANINLQDNNGNTLLITASEKNQPKIVELLVNASANLNIQNHSGQTALMHACRAGNREIVSALIHAGADVNIKTNNGQTALNMTNNEEIRNILISAGAIDAGPEYPSKNIPRGSENAIFGEQIEDGQIMANIPGEFGYRYYKKSTYNAMPEPKIHPITRVPMGSISFYKARLVDAPAEGGKR